MSTANNFDDEAWESNLKELKNYKEENGHCRVPTFFATDRGKKLGIWVKKQRQAYAKGKMLQTRFDALNAIGFCWDAQDEQWQQHFELLKQFKEENNHCTVPTRHPTLGTLRTWVETQRNNYKKNKLSDRRISKLNSIGFVWNPSGVPGNTNKPRHVVQKQHVVKRHYVDPPLRGRSQAKGNSEEARSTTSRATVKPPDMVRDIMHVGISSGAATGGGKDRSKASAHAKQSAGHLKTKKRVIDDTLSDSDSDCSSIAREYSLRARKKHVLYHEPSSDLEEEDEEMEGDNNDDDDGSRIFSKGSAKIPTEARKLVDSSPAIHSVRVKVEEEGEEGDAGLKASAKIPAEDRKLVDSSPALNSVQVKEEEEEEEEGDTGAALQAGAAKASRVAGIHSKVGGTDSLRRNVNLEEEEAVSSNLKAGGKRRAKTTKAAISTVTPDRASSLYEHDVQQNETPLDTSNESPNRKRRAKSTNNAVTPDHANSLCEQDLQQNETHVGSTNESPTLDSDRTTSRDDGAGDENVTRAFSLHASSDGPAFGRVLASQEAALSEASIAAASQSATMTPAKLTIRFCRKDLDRFIDVEAPISEGTFLQGIFKSDATKDIRKLSKDLKKALSEKKKEVVLDYVNELKGGRIYRRFRSQELETISTLMLFETIIPRNQKGNITDGASHPITFHVRLEEAATQGGSDEEDCYM